MTYEYNAKSHYAPYGKHQEMITGKDLTQLEIVVRDDNDNFAVHCATSRLGVSTEHLNSEQPLVIALYRFHAYYHVRQILKRMSVPTPSEEGFDKYNNAFLLEEVRRIRDDYGVITKNLGIFKK